MSERSAPARRSWVESANDPATDFPIQNLPFGVFRRRGTDERHRIGVAIGDQILDLRQCVAGPPIENLSPTLRQALSEPSLNALMAMGKSSWMQVRRAIENVLDVRGPAAKSAQGLRESLLLPMADAELALPGQIGDYSDFYASIHHATNVGSMFRPDNPLLPNYKHLPVGYHGRASSIIISGTPVRRPMGQTSATDTGPPTFGLCKLLDYEMELGFFVGPGNAMGTRIPMADAADHIFGMVIVNDWSARDIQKWEYQPLGPFNAKNFATSISPWVVTMEALEPFRVPGPIRSPDDPEPLEYLKPVEKNGGLDITVEVYLSSAPMRERGMPPLMVSRGNFSDMYWTIGQMLVHHTSTGCNMRPGDLLASGTISGPQEASRGCLLERTWRGQNPLKLPDGTDRKFLQDGDEVTMKAYCQREGCPRIGFGECRGVVLPSQAG